MGDYEAMLVGIAELLVRYHSVKARILTFTRYLGREQFQVGSLTGAVASQMVMEARKGSLRLVGNQSSSVKV